MFHLRVDMRGGCPDLSKPQAFKNVRLQMMTDKTSTFRRIFHKNLLHFQVFDVRYINGKVEAVPFYRFQLQLLLPQKFATSSFRFLIPSYNITKCCVLL